MMRGYSSPYVTLYRTTVPLRGPSHCAHFQLHTLFNVSPSAFLFALLQRNTVQCYSTSVLTPVSLSPPSTEASLF